jgi:hypothetical protein
MLEVEIGTDPQKPKKYVQQQLVAYSEHA